MLIMCASDAPEPMYGATLANCSFGSQSACRQARQWNPRATRELEKTGNFTRNAQTSDDFGCPHFTEMNKVVLLLLVMVFGVTSAGERRQTVAFLLLLAWEPV